MCEDDMLLSDTGDYHRTKYNPHHSPCKYQLPYTCCQSWEAVCPPTQRHAQQYRSRQRRSLLDGYRTKYSFRSQSQASQPSLRFMPIRSWHYSVANPNWFSVNFQTIKASVSYPGVESSDLGGGQLNNVNFAGYTQSTFNFPLAFK